MYINDHAIEVHNQGLLFGTYFYPDFDEGVSCHQRGQQLKNCVLKNNINILDHNKVRSICDVQQWRNSCSPAWRRAHIEHIYRLRMNQNFYNQKDCDAYMNEKNNLKHENFVMQ